MIFTISRMVLARVAVRRLLSMSHSQSTPRARAHHSALVFSDDPVVAALLLSLLELEGFTPRYADHNEPPADAVARLRPRVVLVDCDHAAAMSDAFYTAASEAGAAVIVFSPMRARSEIEAAADEHAVRWFTLPIDQARLRRVLADVMHDAAPSSD